ncbi:FAD:protein FMN transferase [Paenibacillus pabuli]|uniref:FAD:protein FMN transferase n=1 Tax=Paenibacillus pabuli TaxID=1472 RepID=UPI001FFFF22E|nr:FAD:protein FMN transferase [Paenibacillus pabuli]
MDTVVDIQVVTGSETSSLSESVVSKIDRAFNAFRHVEQACSRFSSDSELMKACTQIAIPVGISPFLFEPLKLALDMAEWTKGVFDPTIGKMMEMHGFNRHYLTQRRMNSFVAETVNYQDIVLDEFNHTLMLRRPLVIDLGAVAKGFAIDLAAQELQGFDGFVVNAGGDIYAGGLNERGEPWEIGIQHPEHKGEVICSLTLSNEAACTSGSYERRSAITDDIHHLIDPVTGHSPKEWVSSTVIAPYAMMADVFSSAVMLLGMEDGRKLIHLADVRAILITSDLQLIREGGVWK